MRFLEKGKKTDRVKLFRSQALASRLLTVCVTLENGINPQFSHVKKEVGVDCGLNCVPSKEFEVLGPVPVNVVGNSLCR